ncbi:MAG: phosphoribosylglycinamide formyltransferase [Pseudomonadota bacterium]
MKRVAILISGGGSNMATLVDDMTGDHPARPVVVVSNVPGAGGLAKAKAAGLATATVDHRSYKGDRPGFEAALDAALTPHAPDILCLAGFMRILTPGFVTRWQGKMLNIHPSLLPKYPGLHTHARAIEARDTHAGCSVHLVTPELDAGPVLGQGRVPILPGDTPKTLATRVLAVEHLLYPAVLRRFATGDMTRLDLPQ